MVKILIKVHESYRWVVAVCDEDVFGRKLMESGVGSRESGVGGQDREPQRVLDVSGAFFNGKAMSDEDAENEIVRCVAEDATFNFVGERSVGLAKKLGIVKSEGVAYIEGVPFALVLL